MAFVKTVVITPTVDKFSVEEAFRICVPFRGTTVLYHGGDGFQSWFFGKTEESSGEINLQVHKILQPSNDSPVISELGGFAKVETTLAAVHAIMEKHDAGEIAGLITKGHANIFCVRDINGVRRLVIAHYLGDGWQISGLSAEALWTWEGDLLFSPSSQSLAV